MNFKVFILLGLALAINAASKSDKNFSVDQTIAIENENGIKKCYMHVCPSANSNCKISNIINNSGTFTETTCTAPDGKVTKFYDTKTAKTEQWRRSGMKIKVQKSGGTGINDIQSIEEVGNPSTPAIDFNTGYPSIHQQQPK